MAKETQLKSAPPSFPHPMDELDRIVSFRPKLLRYAVNQLRDEYLAEDVVQECLTAAIAGLDKFNRNAKLDTWVFSILVNKVRDEIRRKKISPSISFSDEFLSEDDIEDYFDHEGSFSDDTAPSHWHTPESLLSNHQFLVILQTCLDRLPEGTSQVFLMREVTGLETSEICGFLNISPNNCAQILYRARLILAQCLNHRWFQCDEGIL
jgi:RNA polymerase sigma-70 factor (ECF subfamily)